MLRGAYESFKRAVAVCMGTRESACPMAFCPVHQHVGGGLKRVDTGGGLAPNWVIVCTLIMTQHCALAHEDLAAASDAALEGWSVELVVVR